MNTLETDYDYLIKIVIVGDSGVGKSCIMKRFTDNEFHTNFISTIGVDFSIQNIVVDRSKCKLQIWDTAGQERFANIAKAYYRNANAIFIVFDVTNEESFASIQKRWVKEVQDNTAGDIPIILVANKIDKAEERVVSKEDAEALSKELGHKIVETSAKTSTGIVDAFVALSKEFIELYGSPDLIEDNKNDGDDDIIIDGNANSKGTCCVLL